MENRKEMRRQLMLRQIDSHAGEILQSKNFLSGKENIQHGRVTVYEHSMNVAVTSLLLKKAFKIKCDERAMIRGALLHDYFLYDWHTRGKDKIWEMHGFKHPTTALENARKEFHLSKKEQDIIKKHMWPLTIIPPMCTESWIVTCADKWCSLQETIHRKK